MNGQPKLPLQLPHFSKTDRYFTVSLKKELRSERTNYDQPPRMLIVSDIEGCFLAFVDILRKAGVVDKKLGWTFNDGHLVILGNCFNGGKQFMECLWLIYYLEDKALKSGGYVHLIMGDQEIVNLNGYWRHLHPKYAEQLRKAGSEYFMLFDGNNELWRWLKTKNIVERIGGFLFVHGGISREILNFNLCLDEINKMAKKNYSCTSTVFSDPVLRLLFNTELSPFLYQGYYLDNEGEDLVSRTMSHYGVNIIITGCVRMEAITVLYNGRVINVNINHAIGRSQALFVENNIFYRVNEGGTMEELNV